MSSKPVDKVIEIVPSYEFPRVRSFKVLVSPIDTGEGNPEKIKRLQKIYDTHSKELIENLNKSLSLLKTSEVTGKQDTLDTAAVKSLYQSTSESLAKLEAIIIAEFQKLQSYKYEQSQVGKKRKRNKRYDETVSSILEEWWNVHIDNPYPSEQEKELLSEKCNISVKQVSTWFANKRARAPECQMSRSKSTSPSPHMEPTLHFPTPMDPEDLFKDIDLDDNLGITTPLDNWQDLNLFSAIQDILPSDNLQWLNDE